VNSDSTGRGSLKMGGSHILQHLINGVARGIRDPEKEMSVWKRCQAFKVAGATNAVERRELRERADLPLEPPGSGSDYTAFVDFLGIPCLNIGFDGESNDQGIYHSIYDDYYWYSHYGDTNFAYGKALAQTIGATVLRLADAEVIPFEFDNLVRTVGKYTEELKNLLKHKQEEIEEQKRQLEEGVYAAISDPQHPKGPPEIEAEPPELNFAPLENAIKTLAASARRYQKAAAKAQPKFDDPRQASRIRELNQTLLQAERCLTDAAGLPRRSWYKHVLYAPGVYSGYGAKTMPGVREGIELGRYDEAEKEIARVAKAIEAETALLNSASAILERLGR